MGDGTQTYMFSFGPLSGLQKIAAGQPGTDFPAEFNTVFGLTSATDRLQPGDPATTDDASGTFTYNGAVGLVGDAESSVPNPSGVKATATAVVAGGIIDDVTINNPGSGYNGPATVLFAPPTCTPGPACETALGTVMISGGHVTVIDITFAGEGYTVAPAVTISAPATACSVSTLPGCLTGHVDPRQIMDIGVMNGTSPRL